MEFRRVLFRSERLSERGREGERKRERERERERKGVKWRERE